MLKSIRRFVSTFTLVASCLASGVAVQAAPNAAEKIDYSWWRTASPDARAAAVRAAMLAGQEGWVVGYSAARNDLSRAIIVTKDPGKALYALNHTPNRDGPVYREPVEYYVAAVSTLYAKHPSLRKREVEGIVFTCLPSNASKPDCDRLIRGGW